jgi:hypothetical protein
MPIDDTPLEQLVVALATKWTGNGTVLLLAGEETETAANEGVASKRMEHTERFMELQLSIRNTHGERAALDVRLLAPQTCGVSRTVEKLLLTLNLRTKIVSTWRVQAAIEAADGR